MNKMRTNNEIFTRHNIKFIPKEPISHFVVQNGWMLLSLQSRKLQHIRISTGVHTEIPIQLAAQDKISSIFLDYKGIHGLVSTTMGENFYVNMKLVAIKSLKKLKGNVITAIGWNNKFGSVDGTGFIVLGTNKGSLMETSINSAGQQSYLKVLTNSLCQDKDLAISSVQIGPCSLDNDNGWMVIVCIPGQVFCLTGTLNLSVLNPQTSQPVINSMWSAAMLEPQQPAVIGTFFSSKNLIRCHSTSGPVGDSTSNFCIYPVSEDDYELPEKYVWLSADGISCGSIKTNKNDGYEMLCQDWHMQTKLVEGVYKYPINIALSEYHVGVLHSDRFSAISLLNQKVAFEDVFQSGTKVVGLSRDMSSQLIWVFTETAIFNYRPVDEARDVWRIMLERNEFVAAQKITKLMPDPKPYQIVIKKLAGHFLAQHNFVGAAEILAKSTEPFESTVMKFLKVDSRESRNGLKCYLDLKLNSTNNLNKVQRDILIIWLLEIQLSELAELKRNAVNKELNQEEQSSSFSFTQKGNQIKKLREELYCFLNRQNVTESVSENRAAVYRLITSHVDFELQSYVANKLKDYDVVVKIHLLQKDYKKALEVIAGQSDPTLFYKYAEDLFEHVPREFVATLMNAGRLVNPGQIISIFFNCQSSVEKIASAFVYLSDAVDKNMADQATHDFLIKLYTDARPNSLLEHLKTFGKNKRRVYNVSRALRICIEKKLHECCVFLYCLEEMYETAVKLALSTNRVDLAKECAIELNQSSGFNDSADFFNDDIAFLEASQRESNSLTVEAKKHVWLEIAKYMIQQNYDVSKCMELLKESNNVIKIQDILSFFPEFSQIEHFKQPLCDCLRDHASKIQELQKEMSYVSESAAKIRSHIEKSKSNVTVVKASDKCSHCTHQLLSRPFFIFNCRHFLHYDCTIEYLRQCFSTQESGLLDTLIATERSLHAEVLIKVGREQLEAEAKLAVIRRKIKEFIASECPICGHDRLNSLLSKPIATEQQYQKLVKDWVF